MKNKLKSARTFGIWSGHIPEKYQYNPRLPKGNTFMAWFNMYSPLIQNGMREEKRAGGTICTAKRDKYAEIHCRK